MLDLILLFVLFSLGRMGIAVLGRAVPVLAASCLPLACQSLLIRTVLTTVG